MSQRFARLSVLSLVSVLGLTGCGSGDPASPEPSPKAAESSGGSGGAAHGTGGAGGTSSGGSASQGNSGGGAGAGGATAGIKYDPGHYAWVIPDKATSGGVEYNGFRVDQPVIYEQVLSFVDGIANHPGVVGIQVIADWAALEGASPGDHAAGFAAIDAILARLAQHGKHLMLSVATVHFGSYPPSDVDLFFPKYIVEDDAYGVSKFNLNGEGLTARIWQPATNDRLIALSQAYAARYDANPAFEMLAAAETSVNLTLGTDGYTGEALGTELVRFYDASRKAWPSTALRLNANFFPGGNSFVAEVQSPELGGKEGTWTPKELFDHTMNGDAALGVEPTYPQYFVWCDNRWEGGPAQKWDTGILPFIDDIGGVVGTGAAGSPVPPSQVPCPTGYATGCRSE